MLLECDIKYTHSQRYVRLNHRKLRLLQVNEVECQASLVAQTVKNAVQGTGVQCPGREDPLEEDMATHSSILAWRIPWTEGPGGLWSMGSKND